MAGMDHAPPPFFQARASTAGPSDFLHRRFAGDIRVRPAVQEPRTAAPEHRPGCRPGTAGVAQTPAAWSTTPATGNFCRGMHSLQQENDELKRTAKLTTAPDLQRLAQLEAENERLRKLLSVTEREKRPTARFRRFCTRPATLPARKVIVDKGQQSGITAGQPAIDDAGVVGQVTRVFLFVSAEIT